MNVIAYAMLVILQYINVSNHHVVHLKLAQCLTSIK